MALDFPLNPTAGTLYQTGSSATYEYTNRNYWEVVTPSPLEVISASFATSASYAVTSSLFVTNADTASILRHTSSLLEVHVCTNSGTDQTGSIQRGSLLYPYKTINYALARIGAGSGYRLIVHRGQYAEDLNITQTNMHLVGYNAGNGSLVEINGTVTVAAGSSSTRISNIRVNALRHTGAGSAFIDQVTCTVSASFASGYAEVIDSRFECPSGISHTAGTLIVFGSTFSPLTTNNAAAVSYLKDCIGVAQPTLTAGTMAIINCQVSAAVSGSPAINTSAGTLLNLVNTNIATSTGVPTKINVGGFLSYNDCVFEKPGSTLGTQVAQTARFQTIDANAITLTGSLGVSGSVNVLNNELSVTGTGVNMGNALVDRHTVTGSLSISGSVNILGSLSASLISGSIVSASFASTASFVTGSPNGRSNNFASGYVNAGVDVTLGNLRVRMAATGNASLQASTVTGNFAVYGSNILYASGVGGSTIPPDTPRFLSTTPVYLNPNTNFNIAGQTDTWLITDTLFSSAWRISLIVGTSYNNNFISIERLF